MDKITSCW